MRSLHSRFADDCEFAARSAVATTVAVGLSQLEAVADALAVTFLIGVIALLVQRCVAKACGKSLPGGAASSQ